MTARPSTVPDDLIRDAHTDGHSVAFIAGAVGLSARRVRERLAMLELVPHKPPRGERVALLLRIAPEQREEIRRRAMAEGLTMTAYVLARCLPG